MTTVSANDTDWLKIDPETTALCIESAVQTIVQKQLKRRGVVVGLSGGIDSSVVAALSAHALGSDHVLGLMMPERECSLASLRLGTVLAEYLHIPVITEEITGLLRMAGCYARRDEAIRQFVPDFGPMHSCKLITADLAAGARYPLSFTRHRTAGWNVQENSPDVSNLPGNCRGKQFQAEGACDA